MVIVGGGFAGLFAARALRPWPWQPQLARRDSTVRVTLIDHAEHHLFQPLLYQCATGILSEGQIALPLRHILKHQKNVECVLAEVVDIDPGTRQVFAARPGGESLEFCYDDLVIAVGVQQSYFGHDEFARWAPGMKTIDDALDIRRRVFGAFEMAETETDLEQQRRWLTFALVGAGPTGVELAGQLRELATRTLRSEFRRIRPEYARVLLFDGGPAPLVSFGPKLSGMTAKALRAIGVELHMNSIVTDIDVNGLVARDNDGVVTRYEAATVLWAAGVEAPPLAATLAAITGAQQDQVGRIRVAPDLTIPGYPEISVVGDLMNLDGLPGVAEVALQSGLYAARRIRRRAKGDTSPAPFRYLNFGSAAYIARGRAVVSAGPVHFGGFLAWIAWLFIHIGFLTGFRNRVGAVLTWWVTFTRGSRRERAFTTHQIERLNDFYPVRHEREGRNPARPPASPPMP